MKIKRAKFSEDINLTSSAFALTNKKTKQSQNCSGHYTNRSLFKLVNDFKMPLAVFKEKNISQLQHDTRDKGDVVVVCFFV